MKEMFCIKDTTKNKLYTLQIAFFVITTVLLSALNLYNKSIEIKRPIILLAGTIFVLLDFKNIRSFSFIKKIIMLYIIEMLFNQLDGSFFHIDPFSLHLSLTAMIPLTASFMCSGFNNSKLTSKDNNLLKSWILVFALIILHMIFLFVFLQNIYGYGYDHNFAVLANICLYFLVFIFTWYQLQQRYICKAAAIVFIIFFVLKMLGGF